MRQLLAAALVLVASTACAAPPCSGMIRSLTDARKAALAPAVARQLHVHQVEVRQSFQVGTGDIIYVDTHQSDKAFVFYAHDPLTSHFITLWSGAAMRNEEQSIEAWTIKNAPGIPVKLASCFAWHVTKNRDQ